MDLSLDAHFREYFTHYFIPAKMLYDPCPLNDPTDPTCDMSPWEKYSGGALNFNYRRRNLLLDDGNASNAAAEVNGVLEGGATPKAAAAEVAARFEDHHDAEELGDAMRHHYEWIAKLREEHRARRHATARASADGGRYVLNASNCIAIASIAVRCAGQRAHHHGDHRVERALVPQRHQPLPHVHPLRRRRH